MTTQQQEVAPSQDGQDGEHTRLGAALGRAGVTVGDSLTGLTRRGEGDNDGSSSSAASKAAAAAALSAAATLAGRRLVERPRRRVAGVAVPGTRRSRRSVVKDLARRLPGVG
jgi:hypothetical protein